MSFSQPFLLPISPGILKNPKGEEQPLVIDKSLALVAWKFISTSGLEGYRETLVKSGISKWAAHPIVNSKRQNLLVNPLMPGGNKKDTHT